MFWTVLALATTVVMGGIIAYYGDLIGRKYGKKRLSWFGLRPKYTAILITSISGALISTLTMAVLFLLVPPIRRIILDGETAIREAATYKRQRDIAREEAEAATVQKQAEIKRLEGRLAQLIQQLDGSRTQLASVHAQLAEVERDKRVALADRDRARALQQQAMSRYAQVVAQTAELKKQKALLTSANRQLAEANISLHDKNAEMKSANDALSQRNASLTETNQQLSRRNADYTQQNSDLAKQNVELSRDNTQMEEQRVKIARRTKDLSDYNAELEARNARLLESARQLLGGYRTLRDAYTASRVKRVVVHKGEDLARIVIPARSTPEQVRTLVQNLLSDASQAAVTRGASPGDQARAVQVANRLVAIGDDGDNPLPVSGDERIDELTRKLSYQLDPMCLQAVAVENSVEDEPASVELIPRTNREIYSKGQQIAIYRINAGESVDKLFDDVVGFLRSMGQSAVQQGMIPRMDSAGEPQVGSLTAAEIAKLVEKVREHNGYVRIRAIAAADINAAGPLALNFKVGP